MTKFLNYDNKLKFIDLFAGIGGIRIAFEANHAECVFSSEWDPFAQKTYSAFFGESPNFSDLFTCKDRPGDITQLPPNLIPDHNILTGGFPCQPFSLAGVSKKRSMGRAHGFDDPTQGTLFFNVKEIINEKQPEAFLLENVKNLLSHDKGNTFRVIRQTLEDDLDYDLSYRVIDGKGWVPQHRERVYLVGFRRPNKKNPKRAKQSWKVDDFQKRLDNISPTKKPISFDKVLEESVPEKYTLGVGTWNTLVRHKANHKAKGQGFGYGMIMPPFDGKTTRTLSQRYHKDGAEILIYQGENKRPRRLTPLECCRLMGYSKRYQKHYDRVNQQPVSDTQAYRQFGNSVVVPVVTEIAKVMVEELQAVGVKSPLCD